MATAYNFLDRCARTSSDPLAALEREALQRTLLIAIGGLWVQEKRILTLYYEEEMTMKAIGRIGHESSANAISHLRHPGRGSYVGLDATRCVRQRPSLSGEEWADWFFYP